MRPIILKLATKISLECGTYTGVTPNDPEYKILDPVLTDEMAEIAMGLRVRQFVSPEEVAKKVKKPLERVTEVLYELSDLGVCRFAKKDGADKFFLPIWVPGIMEMMVGNKEMCEKYPVIAECFEEYTRKRIAPLAPFVPVGQGMMRVHPRRDGHTQRREARHLRGDTPHRGQRLLHRGHGLLLPPHEAPDGRGLRPPREGRLHLL